MSLSHMQGKTIVELRRKNVKNEFITIRRINFFVHTLKRKGNTSNRLQCHRHLAQFHCWMHISVCGRTRHIFIAYLSPAIFQILLIIYLNKRAKQKRSTQFSSKHTNKFTDAFFPALAVFFFKEIICWGWRRNVIPVKEFQMQWEH